MRCHHLVLWDWGPHSGALRHNTWFDQLAMMVAMLEFDPNFFLGL